MPFNRSSGLLLHITSLPSYGGIGDMGPAAYQFADFLVSAKQRLWQVLPLSPTGYGNSPYAAMSAFAGNQLLVSLEFLSDWGWISGERIANLPGRQGNVDFNLVQETKLPLLAEAAQNFLERKPEGQWQNFERYCWENGSWLENYVLYNVLRQKFNTGAWILWPEEIAQRNPEAMARIRQENADAIARERAIQFAFDEQWRNLRSYCNERGIRIIGDVAIFVNYDSADVWTHPDLFELDEKLRPVRVAGVPPDYFSETGQRWGNPLYKWGDLERQGFDWWIHRIRRAQFLYDIIRLDHFRGFEAYWSIPAEDETAVNGEWVKAPGGQLFSSLYGALGDLPFIAEDLGLITEEVHALRDQFNFPGMRVLQFGFSDRGAHIHLPHRYVNNTVVYTGTHDNDTTLGWWQIGATENEKSAVADYVGSLQDGIVWPLIRAASRSVADICLFPVQDILQLGSEARMNTPSRPNGNWSWRCPEGTLTQDLAEKLAALTVVTDRDLLPDPSADKEE
jgi:4-alpha-glucanotransferase